MEYFASPLTPTNRLTLSRNPALPLHIDVDAWDQEESQQLLRLIQCPHNCKESTVALYGVCRKRLLVAASPDASIPLGKDVSRLIAATLWQTRFDDVWCPAEGNVSTKRGKK